MIKIKEWFLNRVKGRIAVSLSANTILPLILLGLALTLSGIISITYSYNDELEDRLRGVSKQTREQFYAQYPYEITKVDGIYYSGDTSISDFTKILEQYKAHFNTDVSIVIDATVALTTIRDGFGNPYIGHVIDDQAALRATRAGKNYVNKSGKIAGRKYYCVGVPLYYRGYVIGLVFAGVPNASSAKSVKHFTIFIIILFVIMVTLEVIQITRYSRRVSDNLGHIRAYLEVLTQRQTPEETMSPRVLKRTDEIGDLARYVVEAGNQLKTIIGRDALTGLYNRRTGRQFLDLLWDNARVNFTSLAVVMCDIDFFKKVNDTYGHDEGDLVLKRIGAIMDKHCGEQKFAFAIRWGGEEFLMGFLLSGPQTLKVVNKIRDEVKEQVFVTNNNESYQITMTFGVVTASPAEEISSVIARADSKLYQGKENGRDQIVS